MSTGRWDRWFLPGWWRFWALGPQWSSTARHRIGIAPPELSHWQRWESELRESTQHESVLDILPVLAGDDQDDHATVALLRHLLESAPPPPQRDDPASESTQQQAGRAQSIVVPRAPSDPDLGSLPPGRSGEGGGLGEIPDPREVDPAAVAHPGEHARHPEGHTPRSTGWTPISAHTISIAGFRVTLPARPAGSDPRWVR